MTAFLKIDACRECHRALPWEWVPAIFLGGKPLAGTGVWRSQLSDGICAGCHAASEARRADLARSLGRRCDLVRLLGGEKPYREFTLERFEVTPGNRLGFERAREFNPAIENLYLWGPCGVGKTHLAYDMARRAFEETLSVAILSAWQLTRRVRMREPALEQGAIDELVNVEVLVLDDLGAGSDTAYARQILQEVLDGRTFADRAGLVVTGKYSLDDLAHKLGDDSIPSRLAGLCQVIELRGPDRRIPLPDRAHRDSAFTGE
jgi:DNA replication protein DnaC